MQSKLDTQLKNSVDGTTDALLKKLQSVQKDIATQIEEAVAQALTNGIKRGREDETAAEKAQDDARWAKLSDYWATTKKELDEYVKEALDDITDGRSRRRYSNINRHHYDDIAITLFGDDRLSSEATDAVIEMQAIYNAKKNRRQKVTQADLDEFIRQRMIWETN